VASPATKNNAARSWNELAGGWVISSGVFAISQENRPNPRENSTDAANEQTRGPYTSNILPTTGANGYWPTIPLQGTVVNCEEDIHSCTHASAIVVSCGCVSLRWVARAGDMSGKTNTPPAERLSTSSQQGITVEMNVTNALAITEQHASPWRRDGAVEYVMLSGLSRGRGSESTWFLSCDVSSRYQSPTLNSRYWITPVSESTESRTGIWLVTVAADW
jgi:hypothetical protein